MEDSDIIGLVAGALAIGVVGIVALARRYGNRAFKYNVFGQNWQQTLRAVDPEVRIVARSKQFTAEFQHDGLPFLLEFGDHVRIAARIPQGVSIAVPPGGKIAGVAQRVEWQDNTLGVRVGLEKHNLLLPVVTALAPLVRQAIAEAGRVGAGPLS